MFITLIVVFCIISQTFAFQPTSTNSLFEFKSALNARSKSVPFLEQPAALTGALPGDVGFDPLNLTGIFGEKDWSRNIVPVVEPITSTPIKTIDWMVEAELKHGRIAMLAVLGWVAVDFGLRFPGESFAAIPNSLAGHTAAVSNGSMGFLLNLVSAFELFSGVALYDQAKGSGRKPGEFMFDPLGLGKDPKNYQRYATSEVKNGRLAMLAISGILTQAALFPDKSFPFL